MSKKLYYLTTEITPFANPTELGDFSVNVPFLLQEKGHDIRTIIPKYGYKIHRIPVKFSQRLYGISSWNTDFKSKFKFIKRTLIFTMNFLR